MQTEQRETSSVKRKAIRNNQSSARALRQRWRKQRDKRTHEQLYDASDWLKNDVEVEASAFAMMWIGVGLQIAASLLEEMAAEVICEDIVNEL